MAKANELIKKSRTAKQGWVTRLINQCNNLLTDDQLTYNKLARLVDNLKTKWNSYEVAHESLETKLIEANDDKDYEEYQRQHEQIETQYLEELTKFENKLDELTTTSPSGNSAIELPKLTLPTITLPEFGGDISEWPAFWDKFNSLIHQRKDIAKINKFSYLLGQLKSTALLVVSQLSVTEANYDIALKLLKDNYEDKDQITTRLVNKLLDLKTPNHNYEDLQLFRITINSTLESLKLNNDIDAASWLLRIIVQNKLNKKIIETLYFKYSKSYFSLQEIDETLLEICKALSNEEQIKQNKTDSSARVVSKEKGDMAFKTNKSPKYQNPSARPVSMGSNKPSARPASVGSNKQTQRKEGQENFIGSYTTTVNKPPKPFDNNNNNNNNASSTGTKPKSYRTCIFCSELHESKDCANYRGSSQRKDRLNQLGKCSICLSGYHQRRDCRTILKKCPLCKEGIHHMVLCDGDPDGSKSLPHNNAQNYSAAVPVAEVQVQSKE